MKMEASPPHNNKRVHAAAGTDRLSNLPEELIHAVISLLPAWQAVQTSVLSRKWRDLWTTTPCLDLDQQQFDSRPRPTSSSRSSDATKSMMFYVFATKLLFLNRAPALDQFRLLVSLAPYRIIDGWIRDAVTRCPAAIEIHYDCRVRHMRLELPAMDYSRYLGRLRRLRLYKVQLDGQFASALESGCPVLEDVELGSCVITEFSEITLLVVKNLTIRSCDSYSDRLVITAPALVNFFCMDNAVLLRQTAACLVKASVTISLPELSVQVGIQRKLLCSLFNVTSLQLTGFEMAMLVEPVDGFPVFHNLKALSLEECFQDLSDWSDKFTALGSFVQNAPNLKKLSLSRCGFSSWEHGVDKITKISIQNQELRTFNCEKLESVEIKGWFDGDPQIPYVLEAIRRTLGKHAVVTHMPIT